MNWRLLAWWATAVGLAGAALAHFTLVLIALVPWSPLPIGARAIAATYVDPLFRQGWWLFAPNPPIFDRQLHVRGTHLEGGGSRATPWLPLSEPVIQAIQENRLSSRDAALTVLLHGMYFLAEGGLVQLSPPARELLIASWGDVDRQPSALIALERAGSAALAAEYPGLELRQVQVRLTLRRLPPFSERERPLGEPEAVLEFLPVPFQDVTPWSPTR